MEGCSLEARGLEKAGRTPRSLWRELGPATPGFGGFRPPGLGDDKFLLFKALSL